MLAECLGGLWYCPGMEDDIWKFGEFYWALSISGKGREREESISGPWKAGTQVAQLLAIPTLRSNELK